MERSAVFGIATTILAGFLSFFMVFKIMPGIVEPGRIDAKGQAVLETEKVKSESEMWKEMWDWGMDLIKAYKKYLYEDSLKILKVSYAAYYNLAKIDSQDLGRTNEYWANSKKTLIKAREQLKALSPPPGLEELHQKELEYFDDFIEGLESYDTEKIKQAFKFYEGELKALEEEKEEEINEMMSDLDLIQGYMYE